MKFPVVSYAKLPGIDSFKYYVKTKLFQFFSKIEKMSIELLLLLHVTDLVIQFA